MSSNDKPKRYADRAPSDLAIVGDLAGKAAMSAVPGGSFLYDLWKARKEQLRDAIQREADARLTQLFSEMLSADAAMDEQAAQAFLDDADFHALLRACVADIEAEKVSAYASLARAIATGKVSVPWRRHFVLSLKELSADDLMGLRQAYVASEHRLIPSAGPSLRPEHFLAPGDPGSLQSIRVANLGARGFVHEGRLSPTGVQFTLACSKPTEMTPAGIGYQEWTGHHVAIISYELREPAVVELASNLSEALCARRVNSSICAVMRDNVQQLGLFATGAVLLIGKATALERTHATALSTLAKKIPTLGARLAKGVQPPLDVELRGCVDASDRAFSDAAALICAEMLRVLR